MRSVHALKCVDGRVDARCVADRLLPLRCGVPAGYALARPARRRRARVLLRRLPRRRAYHRERGPRRLVSPSRAGSVAGRERARRRRRSWRLCCRRSGGFGPRAARRPARSRAARRRHDLRRLRRADRGLARATAGGRKRRRQFRDAPGARDVRSRAHAPRCDRRRGRGDRLSRLSLRPCTPRDALAPRGAHALRADVDRVARDDAGDDVRGARVPRRRRRRARAACAARLGESCADVAGDALQRRAVLPRRMAGLARAPRGNGRSRRAGAWRSVRDQRDIDAVHRRCRVLRLGDDVRRAAPDRALSRACGAGARRRRHRGAGAGDA